MEFIQSDPVRVIATVRAENEIAQSRINELQEEIASQLGESVQLELVMMQVIRLRVEPNEPESTPEPEATEGF